MSHNCGRALKASLSSLVFAFVLPLFAYVAHAQAQAQSQPTAAAPTNVAPSRITQAISETNLTMLRGNTHPLAQARFDQGAAPDGQPMRRMLLVLKRSADQEAALDALLDQQQDSTSPNFHSWLTPQQFGQQFGPSDQDIQTIANWLESHGFTVTSVSSGRTVIEFSGTAGQVHEAFHTEIHRYTVNGQDRWANSSDPQIPAALAPVIAGINTLYNFPRQAMHQIIGLYTRSRSSSEVMPIQKGSGTGSQYTYPNPCSATSQPLCNFVVAPADFAKIYDVPNLLLNPTPATQYNGDNQTIAIVGDSDVNPNDVNAFRRLFGLPMPANFNLMVSGPDPGLDPGGDETEADLDVQLAGSVAPNATIDLVVSQTTESSLGVDLAAQYAVDNNLAPVLNESFGICEFFMGTTDNTFYDQLWQQAAAEGITVTVSSGDGGSAVCDQNAETQGAAKYGLSVSGFTSTPYNVSVGGTDFNDLENPTPFWSSTNNSSTLASALGYIPEMSWNDTCTNAEVFSFFDVTTAEQSCNNSDESSEGLVSIGGGSGGQSNCTVSGVAEASCSGGYPKPSWQTGAGVPADGKRDIPDVSLFASNGFNGSFYLVCESDIPGANCYANTYGTGAVALGGTSASSPEFAAIISLVNQATGSRQGNANYSLYKLAAQPGNTCASAANPANSCAFYDVPSGSTIAMPCAQGTPNEPAPSTSICPIQNTGDSVGVLSGYGTTAGYDLATGLGSVNVANLIAAWPAINSNRSGTSTTLSLNNGSGISITHGQSVPVSIQVSGNGGAPSGSVALMANAGAGEGVQSFALASGGQCGSSASCVTSSTNFLLGGTYGVTAEYSGDGAFAPSTSSPPVSVRVSPENSKTFANLVTLDSEGYPTSFAATNATYGASAFYLLRTDVGDAAATLSAPTGISSNCSKRISNCPTGTVTLASSGALLPISDLTLNTQGYAEIQTLLAGNYSITANYSGDSSYSPSSGTTNFTIAKAPTNTIFHIAPTSEEEYGDPQQITVWVTTSSTGVAPTGGLSFFLDGSSFAAANAEDDIEAFPYDPDPYGPIYAYLVGTIFVPIPVGTHSLTFQYSGDANYASATSDAITINVAKAQPRFLDPGADTVTTNENQQTTFSQWVEGTIDGVAPTGSVSFFLDSKPLPGTVTYTPSNSQLLATLTYSPAVPGSHDIEASYSGDANYTALPVTDVGSITVIGPDFSVGTNGTTSETVSAGQSATYANAINIAPIDGFSSTVNLSCSLAAAATTCSVNPSSLPAGSGSATVIVTTTSRSSASLSTKDELRRFSPEMLVFPMLFLLSAAGMRFVSSLNGRFPAAVSTTLLVFVAAAILFVAGCGGGAAGNGDVSNPPPPTGTGAGTYQITVTATSGAISHTSTLTLTVQ